MAGLFGGLFDFNHDGKMNFFERSTEFMVFNEMMNSKDTSDIDFLLVGEEDEEDELELAGLDVDDLELMDEDERRETLEDAGLDPDDYDFY